MTSQTGQRLRHSLTVVLAAAVVFALASQIYSGIRTRVEAGAKLQQTTEQSAVLTVDITHPLSGAPTQEVVLPGSTQAFVDSPIYARTSGYLKRWYFDIGAAPKSDVAQAQTQLDTTRVADTDIGVMRAQYEHAIAILLGKPPAEFSLPSDPLNLKPPVIPIGVPAQLLERRPDIAAVERRMAEANEQIGIARATFYPTVSLSAAAGFEGSSILSWLTWPSRLWAVGPTLTQTLFDGGRRRATSDAALAGYDAMIANYRETILAAFQQVEDNLAATRILEQEAQQQKEAVDSAQQSLQIFTTRYTGGVDTYLQVITAQTIALSNEQNDVDILRRRMDASVLLIKALGGGWNVANLPKS